MDVVTAFLNSQLEKEIYMEQPDGYIESGIENLVCNFNKSLYGLKQSPRCWNTVFKEYMETIHFKPSTTVPCVSCVYVQGGEDMTIVAVYVDNLIIITKRPEEMRKVEESLAARFKMKDMGKLHYCLGINIQHDEETNCLRIHQKQYIMDMIQKYGLADSNINITIKSEC